MADNKDLLRMDTLSIMTYNRPYECKKCGGVMIFKGVGEYQCEDCGALDYDEYGIVRNYIEKHSKATMAYIAAQTGVSQKSIRQMLKEGRLEIAPDSRAFLKCEMCGKDIRSGSLCEQCEKSYHRSREEMERAGRKMTGYGTEREKLSKKGEKRFNREE